ncbi:hypothetical protein [Porphyromonas levii]|uniref:PLAT domain-containing protein n=2 Tax=Porphyromonas levii TaxID=28114 RepID=A0A4Y8WMC8_9PORP|nr:hypothetical protein [Porphyromonas levii]MBR8703452.1 hypothetical protein [Porphyromonas levii]MBR8759879.1 hypothetical protein [Porphyromonas levii]TFH93900.1 hypothetical protein E4P47_09760 [Porphyromonas levii]TFH95924.1 hypothetical protein E4P48_06400 [Porphyromonas levii]
MTKMFFGVMVTLIAITIQSCHNADLPKQGSRNNYEYTFDVFATDGDANLSFITSSDGDATQIKDGDKVHNTRQYDASIKKGDHKVYSITTQGAREFRVKITVLKSSASGYWVFTGKRNGKVVRTEKHNFKGRNGKEVTEYWNSTL